VKGCKKAVRRRNKKDRPQNRHLRPFKKGDPNIPKSPGRPRTPDMLHEIECWLAGHPSCLEEYFSEPVTGKKRLNRLIELMMQRCPVRFANLIFGEPGEMPIEDQDEGSKCQSPEEIMALEIAHALTRPGESVDFSGRLDIEVAKVIEREGRGFVSIETLPVSAKTKAFLLRTRQLWQERQGDENQK
jgi:hypothetical protein